MKKLSLILFLFCVLGNSSLSAQKECRMMMYEEYDIQTEKEFNNQLSQYISNGYYYLEGFSKKRLWMVYYPIDIDENKNFEIETSIKRIHAARKRYSCGIIYGSDRKNYYFFIIL